MQPSLLIIIYDSTLLKLQVIKKIQRKQTDVSSKKKKKKVGKFENTDVNTKTH